MAPESSHPRQTSLVSRVPSGLALSLLVAVALALGVGQWRVERARHALQDELAQALFMNEWSDRPRLLLLAGHQGTPSALTPLAGTLVLADEWVDDYIQKTALSSRQAGLLRGLLHQHMANIVYLRTQELLRCRTAAELAEKETFHQDMLRESAELVLGSDAGGAFSDALREAQPAWRRATDGGWRPPVGALLALYLDSVARSERIESQDKALSVQPPPPAPSTTRQIPG